MDRINEGCLINYEASKFLTTDSSEAELWIFKHILKKNTVYLKIYESNKQPGLLYESNVYEKLNSFLNIEEYKIYGGNFVRFKCLLENISFRNLHELLNSDRYIANLYRNLHKIICYQTKQMVPLDKHDSNYNGKKLREKCSNSPLSATYNILVTESPSCQKIVSLNEFITDQKLPVHDKKSVIARVGLSINFIHNIGLSHNDLHWNNIIVTLKEEPESYEYTVNDIKYTFKSKFCPVLLDWDRAQWKSGQTNKLLLDSDIYPQPFFCPQNDLMAFAAQLYKSKCFKIQDICSIFLSSPELAPELEHFIKIFDFADYRTYQSELYNNLTFNINLFMDKLEEQSFCADSMCNIL